MGNRPNLYYVGFNEKTEEGDKHRYKVQELEERLRHSNPLIRGGIIKCGGPRNYNFYFQYFWEAIDFFELVNNPSYHDLFHPPVLKRFSLTESPLKPRQQKQFDALYKE